MHFTGRRVIYSDYDEITDQNVLEVLSDAMQVHAENSREIDYLYNYYKGKQPIWERKKEYRQEINNKVVENRANEIVSFKVGYLMGEPVQYVNRGKDEQSEEILLLNDFMFAESKASKDKELADWFTICGTAYRMVLPDPAGEEDEAPFEIYTLDPRYTFIVRHSGLGEKPLLAVKYIKRKDGTTVYSCYTKNRYYEIEGTDLVSVFKIKKSEGRIYGGIPIVEYPANNARLGAFETVLDLLDGINTVDSNALDGLEQFIQSILVLKGVNFEDDNAVKALKEMGAVFLPETGELRFESQELNQAQTQTLKDSMYQSVLTICGMPNRNGGSSTSDTGSAVIMRDGWESAEARAKDSELMFKQSEMQFLKLVLNFVNTYRNMDLRLSAIDIRFTRRNYENIQTKAQVLTMMLANDMIDPRLAFAHCGMFPDPELAYTQSMKWYEEKQKQAQNELAELAERATKQAEADAEPEPKDVTEDV